MPIQVFGQGAVQSSYVSFTPLNTTNNSITLVWPSSYINAPYIDPITDIHYDLFAAYMKVTTGNLNVNTITLPDARETSEGQNFIIRNTGLTDFSLLKADGTLLQVVEVDKAYYGILEDTTTLGGTWLVDTFAAGISEASAAALAGYGLVAIVDKLNTDIPVIVTNVAPVIDVTYRAKLISWTGGTSDITLPLIRPIASVPAGFYFSLTNQGTGTLTVKPGEAITPTSPRISGQDSITVLPKQSLFFINDGNNWQTLGFGQNQLAIDTVNSKNIAGEASPIRLTTEESSSIIQQYNGLLTEDKIIYFPISINNWYIFNNTTGNFTLSVQLMNSVFDPIGASFVVPQGSIQSFYSDATSMYLANTAISLINGKKALPAISFSSTPNTGIYYDTGSAGIGFSIGGVATGAVLKSGALGGIQAISTGGKAIQVIAGETTGFISYNTISAISIDGITGIVTLPAGPLPIGSGGTNAITQAAAIKNLMPSATVNGTLAYYNGTNWVTLAPPAVGGAATAYLIITKATGNLSWSDT